MLEEAIACYTAFIQWPILEEARTFVPQLFCRLRMGHVKPSAVHSGTTANETEIAAAFVYVT